MPTPTYTQPYGKIASTPEEAKANRDVLQSNLKTQGFDSSVIDSNVVSKPVSSLSSNNGQSAINSAIVDHGKDMTLITPKPKDPNAKPAPEADLPTLDTTNIKARGGLTAEEAKATGTDLANYSYDQASGYFVPKVQTGNTVDTTALDKGFDTDSAEAKSIFDKLSATLDAPTASLLSNIQTIYGKRIADAKEMNNRVTEGYKTYGLRTGLSRYNGDSFQGFLNNVERDGLKRLDEIAGEEATKLTEANNALIDKKYDAFVNYRKEITGLRKEKADRIADLQKEANKVSAEQAKQKIQASRDNAISGLVSQGVTDPNEIMNVLNESGGDFTSKEIGDALKVLNPSDSLSGLSADYKTYNYLKSIKDPSIKGMTYFDFQAAVSNAQRKPTTANEDINLSNEKKSSLLGAGFSQPDIINIEKDVQQHGIDKVLEGITDEKQKKALQKVYGSDESNTTLTRESVAKLFDLSDETAKAHSFLGLDYGETNKDKLDTVMGTIQKYRDVGYTDKEIMKMLIDQNK